MISFDAATAVLREFGGLAIKVPRNIPEVQDASGKIHFDPIKAISGDEDRLEYWEELMEERFYPIGAFDGSLLVISQSGQVYMDAYGSGYRIGDSIDLALQKYILDWRNVKKVLDIPGGKRFPD